MAKKMVEVVVIPVDQASIEYFGFNGHKLGIFGFEGRKIRNQMQIKYKDGEWEVLSPPPGAPMIGQVLIQYIKEVKKEELLNGGVVAVEIPDWAVVHLYLEGKLLVPSIESAMLKKSGEKVGGLRIHFPQVDLGEASVVEIVAYPTLIARRRKRPEIKFFDESGDYCNMTLLGPSSN